VKTSRNPEVDRRLDAADHPLEAGRAELEAVIRAWCGWKAP